MRQEQPNYLNVAQHEHLPANNGQLHILLDGALLDAARFAYTHDDNPTLQKLYAGTRHNNAIEVSPCLIQPSAASRLWDVEDQWRDFGIVLQSNAEPNVLAEHLRSLISIRLPSRQLAYCRFYSPKWIGRLLESCTEGELKAFSGPIQRWFAYEHMAWLSLAPTITDQSRPASEEGWFCLRQQQLDLFQAAEEQRYVERMASHFDCPSRTTTEGTAARDQLGQLILQARQYGFTQEHQCTHYLELAWRFPEELKTPELGSLMADQSLATDTRLEQAESRLFGLV